MRTLLCLMAILTLAVVGFADEESKERSRRVRVALALSAGPQLAADGCGVCLGDEAVARGLARAQHKPLVLFVGGCGGAGESAVEGGAVACSVASYEHDGRGATEPRIVVLTPKEGDKWTLHPTLPAGAKVEDIRKVVSEARPPAKAGEPVDWFISAEAKPEVKPIAVVPTTAPVTYTYCTKTGCYTVVK
jgi:hypothetical protein